MDYTALNAAIVEHLGLWWTPEWEAAVERSVGPHGLATIRAMYDLTAEEELWRRGPDSVAYQDAQRRLEEQYPFLSPESVRRLANMVAYAWK